MLCKRPPKSIEADFDVSIDSSLSDSFIAAGKPKTVGRVFYPDPMMRVRATYQVVNFNLSLSDQIWIENLVIIPTVYFVYFEMSVGRDAYFSLVGESSVTRPSTQGGSPDHTKSSRPLDIWRRPTIFDWMSACNCCIDQLLRVISQCVSSSWLIHVLFRLRDCTT